MNDKVKVVTGYKKPAKAGVHYRLVCMTGNNKGISYYLLDNRIILGRGDEADIQVIDAKSSREHAELTRVKDLYVVTDLGSQNGIVINDLKVTQHNLEDNDKIIIGKTVFKYNIVKVDDLSEEILEEDDSEDEIEFDSKIVDRKKPNKKKLIIYGAVLALVAIMMLGDDSTESSSRKKKTETVSQTSDGGFASSQKKAVKGFDREIRDKLAAIIHRGQREYREGNLFRAISEFNLALVLDPKNSQARYYRDKSVQALDDEIRKSFMSAGRAEDSLKYNQAIVDYCSILRLLESYKDDERYKDAEEKKKRIEEKLGLEDEINCLQK